MLEIKGLYVSIGGKEIIKGIDLKLNGGEVHALMGPNGAGKSSLAQALAGHPDAKVAGSVKLDGEELLTLSADSRARKGLFLAFQNPYEIEGVKSGRFIRKSILIGQDESDIDRLMGAQDHIERLASGLGISKDTLGRDLNLGFSGGEKKRLEALQMLALAPKAVILDEMDSGLDVDGIKQIAKAIESMKSRERCFLMITHYPRMLRHVRPDFVHILSGGRIVRSGDGSLADEVEAKGYSAYSGGADAGS